jgi:transcriptional regulator with XRE-family HTH domain
MSENDDIGNLIKSRRNQIGLSLRELANRTELTASFLSQVERGQTSTSINSLRRIADALKVPVLYFLSEQPKHSPVVRHDNRSKLTLPNSEVTYELLTPDLARKMEIFCGRIKSGKRYTARTLREPTEEYIYVLSGILTLGIDTTEYSLEPGDCIYFDGASLRYFSCNSTDPDEEAVWLSVITPPVF